MKKKKKKAKCFIVNHRRIYHEYVGDGNHISLFCLGVWCWMVGLVCFDGDDLCLLGFKCLSILSHIIFHDTKPSSHVLSMNKRTHSETEKKMPDAFDVCKTFRPFPIKKERHPRPNRFIIDPSQTHTHTFENKASLFVVFLKGKNTNHFDYY